MEMRVGVDRVQRLGRVGRSRVAHAVPADDRTRSAVCGSSVRRTAAPWAAEAAEACPECRALLHLSRSA